MPFDVINGATGATNGIPADAPAPKPEKTTTKEEE